MRTPPRSRPTTGPAAGTAQAGRRRRGRPRDDALTQRLLDEALAFVALRGWDDLNSDRLAAQARAGKAGIYRRWPDMTHLIADALATCHLIPTAPDSGSLRADLVALLEPWSRPLNRCEEATAALMGTPQHDPVLRTAIRQAVVIPLAAAVQQIGDQHRRRGHSMTASQLTLLRLVIQALWWERYLDHAHAHNTTVDQLVDGVLLPLIEPSPAP